MESSAAFIDGLIIRSLRGVVDADEEALLGVPMRAPGNAQALPRLGLSVGL